MNPENEKGRSSSSSSAPQDQQSLIQSKPSLAATAGWDGSTEFGRVLTALDALGPVKRVGHNYQAHCPAHDDRHPSLDVAEGAGGRALLKCRSHNCRYEDIMAALALESRSGERGRGSAIPRGRATVQPQAGLTLAAYAEAKQLPVVFLQRLGITDFTYCGAPAVRIPYRGADGGEIAVRFRRGLVKGEDGDQRFIWKKGSKPQLYGLDRLAAARAAGYVVLVEGESCAQTLWLHNIPALGIPGASAWSEQRDAPHLDGIDTVYLVVEPDAGGEALLDRLAESSIRDRLRLVRLEGHTDVSELYLDDPGSFRDRLQAALEGSEAWSDGNDTATEARRDEAWQLCEALAREPSILDRFARDVSEAGLVGEERAAKLLYLVITTRLLDRPVSAVIKGPSSAGKSQLVERVLRFFPEQAHYTLTAGSERILIYSQEPLRHRMLVLYEAAGIQDGLATYLLRSLLSEGRIRYETVEKTDQGMQPRLIERQGPTGLIVTTTAVSLHPENETRLFSIPISDTPAQTKQVMIAIARGQTASIDLDAWQALQRWMSLGTSSVVIPYGEALAELIPPVAVRLRRDFPALLNLISAHALLHQATRERDEDGSVVATIDDYAAVRELVCDLFSDGVGATVAEVERETVAAVDDLSSVFGDGISINMLAEKLQLDKSSASRRAKAALDHGYLHDRNEGRGKKALVVGDPLPDQVELLPSVEQLQTSCTVADEDPDNLTPPPGDGAGGDAA